MTSINFFKNPSIKITPFFSSLSKQHSRGGTGLYQFILDVPIRGRNRPFACSGHMVRNKLCWDANNAVGLPKQGNSYHSSLTFLCFENPKALFACHYNSFLESDRILQRTYSHRELASFGESIFIYYFYYSKRTVTNHEYKSSLIKNKNKKE